MSQIDDIKKPRSITVQLTVNEEYTDLTNKKLLNNSPKQPKLIEKTIPPDGGYGWIVVFASFLCSIIVDGTMFSFGLFLLRISKELDVSLTSVSWVGSFQTAIIGGIISSIAFAVSSQMKSIFGLCLAYGIIGVGFIYLPAIVIVGFYFDKKRAFATGIAVCGSGIGGFVLAPTVNLLINNYGWRKAILFLAGLNLLCAFFALFFKPLKKQLVEEDDNSDLNNNSNGIAQKDQVKIVKNKTYSIVDTNSKSDDLIRNDFRKRTSSMAGHLSNLDGSKFLQKSISRKMSASTVSFASVVIIKSDDQLNKIKFDSKDNEDNNEITEIKSGKMFDLSFLKSPTFLLFSFAGFLTLFGFFIPFMYLVGRAKQLNISENNGAMLLSIIGITNTIGRVICGWLSDKPGVSPFLINNIALILGGAFTIALPIYFNTYSLLVMYSIVFGFSIACFAALRSIITTELFGLDRLTDAFGLLLLIQGIATMTGSPVAGFFYDQTKSYNASFYAAGIVILLSGLLCIPLPMVSKWEEERKQINKV